MRKSIIARRVAPVLLAVTLAFSAAACDSGDGDEDQLEEEIDSEADELEEEIDSEADELEEELEADLGD